MKSLRQKMLAMAAVVAVSGLMMASVAGAAPKLIVKDNATPTPNTVFQVDDAGTITTTSSVFKFDATNKRLGVDVAAPAYPLDVASNWAGPVSTQQMVGATSYNDSARFAVRRADKDAVTGLPKATTVNQQLGNFNFRGHDGTNFSSNGVAAIIANSEETFTPTSQAARIAFVSTPSGTVAGVERVRVPASGGLRIMSLATMPTCDASGTVTTSNVGTLWFVAGGAGVKDTLYVCAKDAGGVYGWRTLY